MERRFTCALGKRRFFLLQPTQVSSMPRASANCSKELRQRSNVVVPHVFMMNRDLQMNNDDSESTYASMQLLEMELRIVHFACVQRKSSCSLDNDRRPSSGPEVGLKTTSIVFSGPSKHPGTYSGVTCASASSIAPVTDAVVEEPSSRKSLVVRDRQRIVKRSRKNLYLQCCLQSHCQRAL